MNHYRLTPRGLFRCAKKCKMTGDISGINCVLFEFASNSCLCLSIHDIKRYITIMVKKYGATDLNHAAKFARDFEIIQHLCELGANNYDQIYQNENHNNNIKTIVYLINNGADYDDAIDLNLALYIKGGAGRIIDDDPKWLHHVAAIPYISHRASIIYILSKYLISDVLCIIVKYLQYEKPPISELEMTALNRQFNTYHGVMW